ncbi:hypothetical protein BGP78_00920 [Pseudoalteromonas sp. MSK9-3]|uniref:hypothetical protein n=1 Tax=Pseudoalteromonas sp. MSK9-3 TaxID=1897633 RepID=UPI000E6CAEEB|nr:hypothetical protein [Pseudoalteromonas sp. MSK9-3]RJE77597.1 hypothetical protein BGP78_00920 [Pseudoalteromonas sp. MSK9-3]
MSNELKVTVYAPTNIIYLQSDASYTHKGNGQFLKFTPQRYESFMRLMIILLFLLVKVSALSADEGVDSITINVEKDCKIEALTKMQEYDVNNCIEFMRTPKHENFEGFVRGALELKFNSPVIEFFGNSIFKDSNEIKEDYVYQAAYRCYRQVYYLVYRLEKQKNSKDLYLWESLVKQHNKGFKVQDKASGEPVLFSVEELRLFFSKFDC